MKWWLSILIGFGLLAVELAIPQIWPTAPDLVWRAVLWGGSGFVLIGLLLGARELHKTNPSSAGRWLPMWSIEFRPKSIYPYRRLIPLGEAARIAYEETRGTVTAMVAERMSDKGEVLRYYTHALTLLEGVTLYGVHPPSTKQEPVPASLLKSGVFTDDGSAFRHHHEKLPEYAELMILKADLRRYIRKAKKEDFGD